MSRIHVLQTDGRMMQTSASASAVSIKFEYRETHPLEVGIYITVDSTGHTVFWRCARDVLNDGLFRDVYPLVGDLRTRTAVSADMENFSYFIYIRNREEEASICIRDHMAVEEFVDAMYEAVPIEEEHPGAGWDEAMERLNPCDSSS